MAESEDRLYNTVIRIVGPHGGATAWRQALAEGEDFEVVLRLIPFPDLRLRVFTYPHAPDRTMVSAALLDTRDKGLCRMPEIVCWWDGWTFHPLEYSDDDLDLHLATHSTRTGMALRPLLEQFCDEIETIGYHDPGLAELISTTHNYIHNWR